MTRTVETRIYARMVAFLQQTQRQAEQALAGEGISPAQYFILATVQERGALQQSELADALGVTPGNVSQLVARLEKARLVVRSERGKAKRVTLSPRGETLVTRLAPLHDRFVAERFSALRVAERRTLLSLLQRVSGVADSRSGPDRSASRPSR